MAEWDRPQGPGFAGPASQCCPSLVWLHCSRSGRKARTEASPSPDRFNQPQVRQAVAPLSRAAAAVRAKVPHKVSGNALQDFWQVPGVPVRTCTTGWQHSPCLGWDQSQWREGSLGCWDALIPSIGSPDSQQAQQVWCQFFLQEL